MKDFNQRIQKQFGPLTLQEIDLIRSYFKEEHLHKNEFFTEADKVCNRLSIVQSGILRVYSLSDGKDITQWISTDNDLITDVVGFFFNQPNRWNIQAFFETVLWTITQDDYRKLCVEFPRWNEIEKVLIAKCFAGLENRVFSHLSMTAEERYNAYFEQNKALFNQVPLQYIASVLGMTPETFSRIRKRQRDNS